MKCCTENKLYNSTEFGTALHHSLNIEKTKPDVSVSF